MSEIHSIGPSLPVVKPAKIIRDDNKQQSKNKPSTKKHKKSEEDCSNEKKDQHIDEIV